MTLLVALRATDGLVLAADSRGTFGDPRGVTAQNDTMIKAYKIAERAGALIAGSGEIGSLLIKEFNERPGRDDGASIGTLATDLSAFARARYAHWFPSIPAVVPPMVVQSGQGVGRPDVEILMAGFDEQGDPHIYHFASALDFAPMLHNYGFAVAGVPQYALYLLNRLYDDKRSIAELSALAVYVITETASQDGKVGGPVQLIHINHEGAHVSDQDQVRAIIDANAGRQASLKSSFYEQVGSK